MNALMTCTSDDLKEAGLPKEASQSVLKFIQHKKRASGTAVAGGCGVHGLEEYQRVSVTSDIKYTIGPAGTGQPSVKYQQVDYWGQN